MQAISVCGVPHQFLLTVTLKHRQNQGRCQPVPRDVEVVPMSGIRKVLQTLTGLNSDMFLFEANSNTHLGVIFDLFQ